MFTTDEIDKSRPCYGEFSCSYCKRQWKSTKAWANHGQNCKNCDTLVYPTKLSKNFVYICDKCHVIWHSCYSASGLSCEKCHSSIIILPRDPDNRRDRQFIEMHKRSHKKSLDISNPNGEHNQSLCEKCRILGRPCREIEGNKISKPMIHISNDDDTMNTINNYRLPNIWRKEDEYKPFIPNNQIHNNQPQPINVNMVTINHVDYTQRHNQSKRSKIIIGCLLCVLLLAIFVITLLIIKLNTSRSPSRITRPLRTRTTTTTVTTTTTTTTTTTMTTTTPANWFESRIEWIKTIAHNVTSKLSSTAPCFAPNTMVTLKSGIHLPLHDLRVGEQVRIDSYRSSPVLAIFRHYRSSILFIEIHINENVSKPLRLTPTHSILVRKSHDEIEQYRFAQDVSIGDFVLSGFSHQMIKVLQIREILHVDEYAYTLLTFEGTIITNNITASCYATYPHSIMHVIMTPIRWLYWILIQLEQDYLHELTTSFCVHFVDWYLQLLFVAATFLA